MGILNQSIPLINRLMLKENQLAYFKRFDLKNKITKLLLTMRMSRRFMRLILLITCLVGIVFFTITILSGRSIIVTSFTESYGWKNSMKLIWSQFLNDSFGLEQACKHPNLDINDKSVAKFFKNANPIECNDEKNWVYTEKGVFHISKEAIKRHGNITCTYKRLQRESDAKTIEAEVIPNFPDNSSIRSDFFKIGCRGKDGKTQHNIYAGIQHLQAVHEASSNIPLPLDAMGVDVFMFGFDSLSRLTFMRKLPKTYKYLTEVLKAIVLKSYNIVGDGTPQALIPIFTGKTEPELPETRKRFGNKANFVNIYPFVWKEFKKYGYATLYAEDCPHIGTFTYRLKGFNEQPTDHYMRTFYVEASQQFSLHHRMCLGSQPRHVVLMNWLKEFFEMYQNKRKFAFSWHSEMSHDDYNLIGLADDDIVQFLTFLHDNGHFNNTVFIFLSDHGHRFAKMRETQQGRTEERLPFFAFAFPPWFETKYPEAYKNFVINSERLTTPFDIHPTLWNLIHFNGSGKGDVKNRAISLFQEIPLHRTCKDAGIEPHWCACLKWNSVSINAEPVKQAAIQLVNHINKYIEFQKDICEELKLDKIISAVQYIPQEDMLRFKQSKDADGFVPDLSDSTKISNVVYQITIQTLPGNAHFESSIQHQIQDNIFIVVIDDISRTNKYGKTANCVVDTHEQLRKFCYCKKQS